LFDVDPLPAPSYFASSLNAELNRSRKTEVINLGIPDTGPKFYARMLELEGSRLSPCAVVLCFFVGNDLRDEPEDCWEIPLWTRITQASLTARLIRSIYLIERVRTGYGLTGRQIRTMEWPRQAGLWVPQQAGNAPGTMPPEVFKDMQFERSYVFDRNWITRLEIQWRSVQKSLLRARDAASQAGASFSVMIIPDETQVNTELFKSVKKMRGTDLDMDKPQRLLAAFLKANHIPVLDLLPSFRRAVAEGRNPYKLRDTHWNWTGKDIGVRQMARHLALSARLCAGKTPDSRPQAER